MTCLWMLYVYRRFRLRDFSPDFDKNLLKSWLFTAQQHSSEILLFPRDGDIFCHSPKTLWPTLPKSQVVLGQIGGDCPNFGRLFSQTLFLCWIIQRDFFLFLQVSSAMMAWTDSSRPDLQKLHDEKNVINGDTFDDRLHSALELWELFEDFGKK